MPVKYRRVRNNPLENFKAFGSKRKNQNQKSALVKSDTMLIQGIEVVKTLAVTWSTAGIT